MFKHSSFAEERKNPWNVLLLLKVIPCSLRDVREAVQSRFFHCFWTLFSFSAFLRYSWHITLCKFKVRNVMIHYVGILWSDYYNKMTSNSYLFWCVWWELSRSTLLQLPSKQHGIVNYSHHTAYYILRTYSSHNWNFVPFEHLQFLRKFLVSMFPTTLRK